MCALGFGHADAQALQWRAQAMTPATPASLEISAVRSRLRESGAGFAPSDEVAGIDYRVWMSSGQFDVGVGLGAVGHVQAVRLGDGLQAIVGSVPTVSLGIRYRASERHLFFADAGGARALGGETTGNYLSTKVGMEWKPARSTLGFEHGALGLQLDSGYRLSLRSRGGGLAVYLRNNF